MKTKLTMTLVAAGLALGTLSVPMLSYAADGDTDRAHPVTFVKDSEITVKVKSQLAAKHISSLAKIHVDTDANGHVWLTGTARSQGDIDTAVSIAKGTERVSGVTNRLTIKKDN